MKHLFLVLITIASLSATAQPGGNQQPNKNSLLNTSFWQTMPTVDAVKAEIAKGNSPSEFNASAFDPVVLAINAGAPNGTILFLLQQEGNNVNKITHDSRTYLHWAASKGNTAIMEYLVSRGAKANTVDSHGATPLNFAAGAGQQDTRVYELCIQNGANLKSDVNSDGANALLLAIGNDPELRITDYFISKGLDLKSKDASGNTAFNYAARSGNIELMKKLQARGVPFTNNAIIMAAQGSRRGATKLEVYQYLESIGLKPTTTGKDGSTALHALARRPGQSDAIQYFIDKGVNVNQADEEGNTAFIIAAGVNRDTAMINLLAAKVKNINQANNNGATALAHAARNNSPEIVQFLISRRADVKTVDTKGNNLVYYLFDAYNPRVAKEFEAKLALLQKAGLNVAAPQRDGNTVYHLAVAKNDPALVRLVQNLGVDVNAKNKEGLTPLHKAAMVSKDDSILQYLVAAGAKKDVKTQFDETAYDLAKENESLAKQKVSVDFLK